MTFPSSADSDPDPTSQIAWPARQGKPARSESNGQLNVVGEQGGRSSAPRQNGSKPPPSESAVEGESSGGKKRMSTLDLIYLSIAMGGSQVAWTVELG